VLHTPAAANCRTYSHSAAHNKVQPDFSNSMQVLPLSSNMPYFGVGGKFKAPLEKIRNAKPT